MRSKATCLLARPLTASVVFVHNAGLNPIPRICHFLGCTASSSANDFGHFVQTTSENDIAISKP
jgi:hypothetical protein